MNQAAVQHIVFFADFTRDGFLSHLSRLEFQSCLDKAALWKATLRIVHTRPVSELCSRDTSYGDSQLEKTTRRIEYALCGLLLQAEEHGLQAEAGIVYGEQGKRAVRETGVEESVVWSEVSNAFSTLQRFG